LTVKFDDEFQELEKAARRAYWREELWGDGFTRILTVGAALFFGYFLQIVALAIIERVWGPIGGTPGTFAYYMVKAVDAEVEFVNGVTMAELMITIVGGLVVAGVSWTVATIRTRYSERNKVAEMLDAAPRNYVSELDKLISQAIAEGPDKAVLNARAIVKVRNDLRNNLVTISAKLNSEIDRLAEQLGELGPRPLGPSVPGEKPFISSGAAWETIQVLQKVWPAKKREIEDAIRQILTEVGLDPNQFKKAA